MLFRFVVVCTYQPDTLTVRASFAVPGRGGAAVVPSEWAETGRSARERQFRLVDKSALVLKENDPDSASSLGNEDSMITNGNDKDTTGSMSEISSEPINYSERESKMLDYNMIIDDRELKKNFKDVNYARLVGDNHSIDEQYSNYKNSHPQTDSSGLVIGVSLSIIMCGAFVYVMQREFKKKKDLRILQSMNNVNQA